MLKRGCLVHANDIFGTDSDEEQGQQKEPETVQTCECAQNTAEIMNLLQSYMSHFFWMCDECSTKI
jgi:hypothetical protein